MSVYMRRKIFFFYIFRNQILVSFQIKYSYITDLKKFARNYGLSDLLFLPPSHDSIYMCGIIESKKGPLKFILFPIGT